MAETRHEEVIRLVLETDASHLGESVLRETQNINRRVSQQGAPDRIGGPAPSRMSFEPPGPPGAAPYRMSSYETRAVVWAMSQISTMFGGRGVFGVPQRNERGQFSASSGMFGGRGVFGVPQHTVYSAFGGIGGFSGASRQPLPPARAPAPAAQLGQIPVTAIAGAAPPHSAAGRLEAWGSGPQRNWWQRLWGSAPAPASVDPRSDRGPRPATPIIPEAREAIRSDYGLNRLLGMWRTGRITPVGSLSEAMGGSLMDIAGRSKPLRASDPVAAARAATTAITQTAKQSYSLLSDAEVGAVKKLAETGKVLIPDLGDAMTAAYKNLLSDLGYSITDVKRIAHIGSGGISGLRYSVTKSPLPAAPGAPQAVANAVRVAQSGNAGTAIAQAAAGGAGPATINIPNAAGGAGGIAAGVGAPAAMGTGAMIAGPILGAVMISAKMVSDTFSELSRAGREFAGSMVSGDMSNAIRGMIDGMHAVAKYIEPVFLPAIVKSAGGFIDTLDGLVSALSKYNPIIYGETMKYEMLQRMFRFQMAGAMQPVMTAWIKIKESFLNSLAALIPLISRIAQWLANLLTAFAQHLPAAIAGFITGIGRFLDMLGIVAAIIAPFTGISDKLAAAAQTVYGAAQSVLDAGTKASELTDLQKAYNAAWINALGGVKGGGAGGVDLGRPHPAALRNLIGGPAGAGGGVMAQAANVMQNAANGMQAAANNMNNAANVAANVAMAAAASGNPIASTDYQSKQAVADRFAAWYSTNKRSGETTDEAYQRWLSEGSAAGSAGGTNVHNDASWWLLNNPPPSEIHRRNRWMMNNPALAIAMGATGSSTSGTSDQDRANRWAGLRLSDQDKANRYWSVGAWAGATTAQAGAVAAGQQPGNQPAPVPPVAGAVAGHAAAVKPAAPDPNASYANSLKDQPPTSPSGKASGDAGAGHRVPQAQMPKVFASFQNNMQVQMMNEQAVIEGMMQVREKLLRCLDTCRNETSMFVCSLEGSMIGRGM